jgi:hypothetical protein
MTKRQKETGLTTLPERTALPEPTTLPSSQAAAVISV